MEYKIKSTSLHGRYYILSSIFLQLSFLIEWNITHVAWLALTWTILKLSFLLSMPCLHILIAKFMSVYYWREVIVTDWIRPCTCRCWSAHESKLEKARCGSAFRTPSARGRWGSGSDLQCHLGSLHGGLDGAVARADSFSPRHGPFVAHPEYGEGRRLQCAGALRVTRVLMMRLFPPHLPGPACGCLLFHCHLPCARGSRWGSLRLAVAQGSSQPAARQLDPRGPADCGEAVMPRVH